jgi:hypothetical protein
VTARLGKLDEEFDRAQAVIGQESACGRRFAQPRSCRNTFTPPVLAREQPTRKREIREKHQAQLGARGKHVMFRMPVQEAVFVLHAHEVRSVGCDGAMRFAQLGGGEVRAPDLTNLPCSDEIIKRTECVRDGDRWIGLMQLVKVDVVSAKAAETGFDCLPNVDGVGTFVLIIQGLPKFRGDDHVLPALTQTAAQEFLAVGRAVEIGGIKEGDARIEGGVNNCGGALLIEPRAEIIAAEANNANSE